jgi:Xaa-Pro aminopeptidase
MTHEKAVSPPRMGALASRLAKRRIDAALVFGEANIRALAGIACDNGCLLVTASGAFCFVTDFRYAPMAHRLAPWLETLCLPAGASFASVLR